MDLAVSLQFRTAFELDPEQIIEIHRQLTEAYQVDPLFSTDLGLNSTIDIQFSIVDQTWIPLLEQLRRTADWWTAQVFMTVDKITGSPRQLAVTAASIRPINQLPTVEAAEYPAVAVTV